MPRAHTRLIVTSITAINFGIATATPLLTATGYNFRLPLRWLKLLSFRFPIVFFSSIQLAAASYR
jgi:hypothetical protein